MASFNSLPNELWLLIARTFPRLCRTHSLAALALTCRRLHQIINPILYAYDRDQNSSMCGRYSALYIAVGQHQVETVGWLLDHGATPDAEPVYDDDDDVNPDTSPLYCAIRENQPTIAQLLIAEGACLTFSPLFFSPLDDSDDSLCEDGLKSAIHVASYYGSISIVRDLVRLNLMDINTPDREGLMCLHYAIMGHQSSAVVNELIRLGADVNSDSDNCPLLWLAIQTDCFMIADILINAGSRIDVLSPFTKLGPLHLCIHERSRFSNKQSGYTEQYSLLEKIIGLGADINGFDTLDQELHR
ncbi:ankyrin repeat-containing domain protein [Rostrohypoxylon terebratum]|nr:ankyrin repeat-containing domain protein [Rostrohypoxylon terebratum]